MTTDRELLEKAAKAAEMMNMKWTGSAMAKMYDPSRPETTGSIGPNWNPLTDDGDALRLAVKLKLEFEWWKNGVSVNQADTPPMPIEHVGDDPYAATRRAIVRAAAAIGERMP